MREIKRLFHATQALLLVAVAMMLTACSDSKYDNWQRWRMPAADSDDPFGFEIFDSIMYESMPKGYQVMEEPFHTTKPSEWSGKAILVTADAVDLETALHIDSLVDRGCRVMLVTDAYCGLVRDKIEDFGWGVWFDNNSLSGFFDFDTLKRQLEEKLTKRFIWLPDGRTIDVAPVFLTGRMNVKSVETVLAKLGGVEEDVEDDEYFEPGYADEASQGGVLAVKVKSNRRGGAFYIVGTPLLMNNYGILDSEVSPYVSRVLALIADRPVTRMRVMYAHNAAEGAGGGNSSTLKYFLSQPALRTALYIVVALLLLFAFFRARRRQRAIPVYEEPVNHSLEFVQIVGNIYYNRGDYRNLLYMKYLFFTEELRRRLMIDINDREADPQNILLLANKTGLDPGFIQQTVNDARSQIIIEDKEALDLIDKMNRILKAL